MASRAALAGMLLSDCRLSGYLHRKLGEAALLASDPPEPRTTNVFTQWGPKGFEVIRLPSTSNRRCIL
jgi:hypothetical protein